MAAAEGGLSWGNWHWVRGSACGFGLDVWWDWPSVAGAHPWRPGPGSHPLQQEFTFISLQYIDSETARNYSSRIYNYWSHMVHNKLMLILVSSHWHKVNSTEFFHPWTRSYKKEDEPLLNLTAAISSCWREMVLMCTQKRELESDL